jgi:hypothetical protein
MTMMEHTSQYDYFNEAITVEKSLGTPSIITSNVGGTVSKVCALGGDLRATHALFAPVIDPGCVRGFDLRDSHLQERPILERGVHLLGYGQQQLSYHAQSLPD